MKDKAPVIVLIIVAAGLALGLIVVNNKARQEKQELYDALSVQSNTVTTIKTSLTEQQAVNQALETNLASTRVDYSNKLTQSEANLRNAEASLEKAQAEAKAQADADTAEVAKRDKKIADLENQNQNLDKQAGDFRDHISGLDTQIAATKDKLARSEGDRKSLLKELKRLETEKAAWEDRFSDVALLKAQLRLLKAEAAADRNLAWMNRGVYAKAKKRGDELLTQPSPSAAPATNAEVNVELHQSGETKIIAPAPSATPEK